MNVSCEKCLNPMVWDNFKKRYVCKNCEDTSEESSLNSPFINY